MAEETRTTLIVDDEEDIRIVLRATLTAMGYQTTAVGTGEAAVDYVLRNQPPSVMLLDLNLPGMGGLETLRRVLEAHPNQKVVMISCTSDADKIVAAVKMGATDYLVKPFTNAALEEALDKCMSEEMTVVAPEARSSLGPLPFLVCSEAMQKIRENCTRVAPADVPVLIVGESGSGKEVIARYLHHASNRAGQKFVKVNCAALPSDLLESELFGYERGAFTGANGSKPGKFELAHKGTLFLDEIAEMQVFLQAKLLHVLQDGRYFRLGATTPTHVDVRVVAATNVNVAQAIADGRFRQDLYYRLNVFSIALPPLRDRREEIPTFVDYFMNKYSPSGSKMKVSVSMLERMMEYNWPGNLRELENFIRRLVILGDEHMMLGELGEVETKAAPAPAAAASAPANSGLRDMKRDAERKAIQAALERTQWRRKEAAKILNISYKALLYKMRDLQMDTA
jgi:two-component system, NtrC family, response regulator AtoC